MVQSSWSLYSLLFILIALGWGYYLYERRQASAREVALVATLAALAGLSRVPFAAMPAVQPTTFLVLVSGYVFGPGPGFMVGSLAAFVSNFFLGHGPWTPWQMAAWGVTGIFGGLLGLKKGPFPKAAMTVAGFCWGFLFGWFLNTWHWLAFVYPLTFRSFIIVQAASLWSDGMHAVGNAILVLVAGNELVRILNRFKRRLTINYLAPKEGEPGLTYKEERA